MKFILISSFLFLAGCSVKSTKEATYNVLKGISSPKCENLVYEEDQINCVTHGRSNYDEYEKYYNEKNR